MTDKISFKTKGNVDIVDITSDVNKILQEQSVSEGIAFLFVPGATGAITTVEYEPGLVADLKKLFEDLIPTNKVYQHNLSHSDSNGHSHLRASLVGSSLNVPFADKKLELGVWQNIIFIEFDNRPRSREIIVKILKI
ncbi:MAG: secondary thiamine-phosphate synthase enzyme YjbQ [Candidatus Firestonebacteria bacterium]